MTTASLPELAGLAVEHHRAGRLVEAERLYRRILSIDPGHADTLNRLGAIAAHRGDNETARRLIGKAIRLSPGAAAFHNNLGNVLRAEGRLEDAAASYGRAVELRQDHAEAHFNLGNVLSELGRTAEAVGVLARAAALRPDYPQAHWNEALARLALGDLAGGWSKYGWRWAVYPSLAVARPAVAAPEWAGEPVKGKTVLLWHEQGFGDTLQFIRYARLVNERGARVLFHAPTALQRLLARVPGIDAVVGPGDPLPAIDRHAALLDLPRLFGTTLATIPADLPYLSADPAAAAAWAARLAPLAGSLKVGLVWAGKSRLDDAVAREVDRRRSLSLAQLAPLAAVGGVRFLSLQKGPPAAEAARPPAGFNLVDLTRELADFADTAALVAGLDLVITVDTSVAHLAGGMGKPVWVLSRFDACWRWLVGREDSPWYPTMRLFRQQRPGDWDEVIGRVKEALADLAASAAP